MKTLRIFVSSPGDVGRERVMANHVLQRLTGEYNRRVKLDPYFWEHEPMRGMTDFQGNIPEPSDFEIVICVLWSRLGSRLNANHRRPDGSPYASGTEYEFEVALEAHRLKGSPEILIYRNRQQPMVPLEPAQARDEKIRQYEALQTFLRRWFLDPDGTIRIATNDYNDLGEFEDKLESDLRKLIEEAAPPLAVAPAELIRAGAYAKGSPFRQLRPFEFYDAEIFFGRTKAIDEVLNAMRDQAAAGCAFTLIFGGSGSGKSSLARAGVLPMLVRPGVIEGIGLWRWAIMRPSEAAGDVFVGLANALMSETALYELSSDAGASVAELAKGLHDAPASVPLVIRSALSRAGRDIQQKEGLPKQPASRVVLLIDQLEELFTLTDRFPPEIRKHFIAAIGELARSGTAWVLVTLRSEFYSRCEEIPELVELKRGKGEYQLLPPSKSELRQIVRLPAIAAALEFEIDADGARLDDVLLDAAAAGSGSGALPLLEFALEELYQRRRDDRVLTHAAFKELKGIEGALETAAEEIFSMLPAEVAAEFERVFRGLVTTDLDEKATFVRRIAELEALASTAERHRLIQEFVERRLLVTGSDEQGRAIVQVAHEALFAHWPRLRALLDTSREFLRRRARAGAAFSLWKMQKRDRSYLWWHGKLLAEAKDLLAHADELTPREKEFAKESVEAGASARHKRWVAMAAAAIVAFAAAVSGYLWWQKTHEEKMLLNLREQLTEALHKRDDYAIAELSREILARAPGDSDAWSVRAQALLDRSDYQAFDAALEQWQHNVSPRPVRLDELRGDSEAKQGHSDQAIKNWSALLNSHDLDTQTQVRILRKLTDAHMKSGQWLEAKERLTEWIKLGDNFDARLRRAEAHRQLRDWDAAHQDFEVAREFDPSDPRIKIFSPLPAANSLHDLDEAIRKSPRDFKAWLARATELTRERQFEAALEDIEKARNLDPDSTRLALDAAYLHWQLENYIPEELAVRPSERWTRDAAIFLPAFEAAQGDLNALSTMDARVRDDPGNIEHYIARGELLSRLGQETLAVRDFNRALEIDQRSMRALERRAAAYQALGQSDAAETDLRRLKELQQSPSQ